MKGFVITLRCVAASRIYLARSHFSPLSESFTIFVILPFLPKFSTLIDNKVIPLTHACQVGRWARSGARLIGYGLCYSVGLLLRHCMPIGLGCNNTVLVAPRW